MQSVEFRPKFSWALCPERRKSPEPKLEIEHTAFRWLRAGRRASRCGPFKLGERLGWIVRAPVDVVLEPFDEIQFACDDEELELTMLVLGLAESWQRGDARIGIRQTLGLRAYDFQAGDHWEAMFLPNGEGTLEWRMGFEALIPDDHSLVLMGLADNVAFDIILGMLPAAILRRMNETTGFSIALRPKAKTRISRGQPIARLLVLDKATADLNLAAP